MCMSWWEKLSYLNFLNIWNYIWGGIYSQIVPKYQKEGCQKSRLLRKIIHVHISFKLRSYSKLYNTAGQAFKIREGNVSWEILSRWLKIKIFWIWKNRLQTISLIGVQGKKYICTPSCGKLFYGTVICFYTFVMLFLYYTFCVKVSHIFLLFSTPKVSNLKSLSKICSKTIPFGLWRHGKLNKMVSPFWGCNRNNPGPVTIQNFVFCISEFWRSVFFYFKKIYPSRLREFCIKI